MPSVSPGSTSWKDKGPRKVQGPQSPYDVGSIFPEMPRKTDHDYGHPLHAFVLEYCVHAFVGLLHNHYVQIDSDQTGPSIVVLVSDVFTTNAMIPRPDVFPGRWCEGPPMVLSVGTVPRG